jgi:Resolvase, N terminal domain
MQLLALRQVAERAGWHVVEEYVDHGISGAKGRDQRPAFDRLMKDATLRKFDIIMECAPAAGQFQAAVLTVCRVWWSSNWAGLR